MRNAIGATRGELGEWVPVALGGCCLALLLGLTGCGDDADDTGTVSDAGSSLGHAGASGHAGRAGGAGTISSGNTAGRSSGSAGRAGESAGSAGKDPGEAGSSAPGPCPPNLALPAICRMCADGSCGVAECSGGRFAAWRCPEDGAEPDCIVGGCSRELCGDAADGPPVSDCVSRPEYDCYATAKCERQTDDVCAFTLTQELMQCLREKGQSSGLRWYTSCGAPVCSSDPDPFDDPSIPNCTTQRAGDACSKESDRCDGVASCGATLLCAKTDPTMGPGGCPISRARFKQEIDYVSPQELLAYHDQLIDMPLASYRYKSAPTAGPQLGFVIEDIEPSVAVSGDHVNMYGYLSMAVAAIQVQQAQIAELQRELERVRGQLGAEPAVCGP